MTRVRLKYISSDVDRHGNARFYFRRAGQRKIRLRSLSGSEEFMTAYKAALAGNTPPATARLRPKASAGTLRWVCQQYFDAAAFRKELAPRTRYVRRRELEKVCVSAGDE